MVRGDWRQAGAVGVIGGIHVASQPHVGESGLDERLIKDHLAVHPDLDRPSEISGRLDHHFKEHPLRDGNGHYGGVSLSSRLSGVRAFSWSTPGRIQPEYRRRARAIELEAPQGMASPSNL